MKATCPLQRRLLNNLGKTIRNNFPEFCIGIRLNITSLYAVCVLVIGEELDLKVEKPKAWANDCIVI